MAIDLKKTDVVIVGLARSAASPRCRSRARAST